MTSRRLSSEMFHASTVARDGRAVMILGPSGSGKSDLALRLFDHGFRLVSDDQARAFWVLADAEGNEACVCTWQDRED